VHHYKTVACDVTVVGRISEVRRLWRFSEASLS